MKISLYCSLFLLLLLPFSVLAQVGSAPIISNVSISKMCEDGYIKLTVDADSQNLPLKYVWSNGYKIKDNYPTNPGTFYVTVTDNKGNSVV